MPEIPFRSFNKTLQQILSEEYLSKAAIWLLGKQETSILAQESGSHWETALSIEFLVGAQEIIQRTQPEESFGGKIQSKCVYAAKWLLSRVENPGEQYATWDYVTWDTAVVTKSLLLASSAYGDKFSNQEVQQIRSCSIKAGRWLLKRFGEWEQEVKYPFGPADIAQILTTLIYVKNNYNNLYKELEKGRRVSVDETLRDIVKYLLQIKVPFPKETGTESGEEELSWWRDFFSSAEVIESLAVYYRCFKNDPNEKQMLEEIKGTAIKFFRSLEYGQDDGMWGTHVDTIRTLHAYVRVPKLIDGLSSEPHFIFKALRWICDEKQRFSDGSFLHTTFLTVFMSSTLLEIHRSWDKSAHEISRIYDDVLWSTPVRTTPERTKRFAAELRVAQLQDEKVQLDTRTERRRRRNWTLLSTGGLALLLLFIPELFEASKFSISVGMTNLPEFSVISTILVAVYVVILRIIWKT